MKLPFEKKIIINDYRIANRSRIISLLGRKEVFSGKAKFGIFGDGKEVPQIAMAHAFKEGDFRSGYYRDQTFMFATGMMTYEQFFAQLYAHTDINFDPASGGRQMNGHFATRMLDESGEFLDLTKLKNCTSDISPTGSQMGRLLGLAYASKLYRNNEALKNAENFSKNGNEVAFGTIGNASTSEGIFYECINAAGVLQVPMAISIWDDEYGISVSNTYQTTKSSISAALSGFQKTKDSTGFQIYTLIGWDYPSLCEIYQKGIEEVRKTHVPAIFHVCELTQPQGHSTSGSHERYKSVGRLDWEKTHDCNLKMREWLIASKILNDEELKAIEKEDNDFILAIRGKSWNDFIRPIKQEAEKLAFELKNFTVNSNLPEKLVKFVENEIKTLQTLPSPNKKEIYRTAKKVLVETKDYSNSAREKLLEFSKDFYEKADESYNTFRFSQSEKSPLNVEFSAPVYPEKIEKVDARILLRECFDRNFTKNPKLFAIGEDIGQMGGVNLAFENLQKKFGDLRITDTGIREASILGQGIGCAIRGLRPIVDIQYIDYLLYALQLISDDLATLHWRTCGGQKAPVIVRTKGHRLEGIWHSGSPLAMILNGVRGVHVLVPRNMLQASGFYNTLFRSDDPAILIEVLNGYRTKETLPENIGEFTIPLGVPETLLEGKDITVVTYGACCKVAFETALMLEKIGISLEIIDVQTLSPFDLNHLIVKSIQKTNKVIFFDEDMPGGTTAFMLQKVLEEQKGYFYLDSEPKTLSAKPNRPAYGTDGDYFTKPNAENLFDIAYELMNEANPQKFPKVF
ncbi:transketolase [bacterium]|nr:transketolase [bacterium]